MGQFCPQDDCGYEQPGGRFAATVPDPPQTRKSGSGCATSAIVFGILAVLFLVVFIALGALGWKSFVRFGVSTDLTDFYEYVQSSDLSPQRKQEFLGRIVAIREKARQKSIGLMAWLSYDESIRALIEDGRITPEEAEVLEGELEQLAGEFE